MALIASSHCAIIYSIYMCAYIYIYIYVQALQLKLSEKTLTQVIFILTTDNLPHKLIKDAQLQIKSRKEKNVHILKTWPYTFFFLHQRQPWESQQIITSPVFCFMAPKNMSACQHSWNRCIKCRNSKSVTIIWLQWIASNENHRFSNERKLTCPGNHVEKVLK